MFNKRGTGALIAALATTALVAAACGGGGGDSGAGGDSTGGSYSTNMQEPDALGPHSLCYASECGKVLGVLYAGLVDLNEQGDLVMRAAKSIDSDDQVHWTIKLKKGWTFHNGKPLNADAYIRAWNWAAYGPNAADTNGFFSVIKGYDKMNATEEGAKPSAKKLAGLEKVDDHTFKVTLDAPFSQFKRSLLYTPAFGAQTKWCLENTDKCNEKPVGTGPYKLVEWKHDQSVVVQRWDGYKGENTGKSEKITFKIYSEIQTAYRDWQAGNLDVLDEPAPENLSQARQLAGDRITEKTENSYYYMGIPLYQDDFTPKMVHALSLAINRKAITKNILLGTGVPAHAMVPPSIPGGGEHACEFCTYDPERAKKLMKEAGGLPMDKLEVWVNSGSGNTAWVKAVANGWRKVFGLDYSLRTPQFSDYLDKLENHKVTGPFRLAWSMDYPSMVNFLKPLYFTGFPSNSTGYSDKKFEELVNKGNAADSQKEAIKYYTKAEKRALETMPTIPVYYGKEIYVWNDSVDKVPYSVLHETPAYSQVVVSQ